MSINHPGVILKNKHKSIRDAGTKREHGTTKRPVFGILCRYGPVWAEIDADMEADTLPASHHSKSVNRFTVCSDIWKAYTGAI